IEKIEVYETTRITNLSVDSIEKIKVVDFISFTSPSTVEAFAQATNKNGNLLQIPAVCIGTTTATSAENIGFKTIIVPKIFTIESMLKALHKHLIDREDRYDEGI